MEALDAATPSVREVVPGVVRLTWQVPLGISHVHCYLIRIGRGQWLLVDTGFGRPDGASAWRFALRGFGGKVVSILVTHSHPDHIGGATDALAATGATLYQGSVDYEQCRLTWEDADWDVVLARHLAANGTPEDQIRRIVVAHQDLRPLVRFPHDPEIIEPGECLHGWDVLHLPGHADGHLCLHRVGMLIAGDAILDPISPTIGLMPRSSTNPLAAYLRSLSRIEKLAPSVAHAGHGREIKDPAGRARELRAHHGRRLESVLEQLVSGQRTAWQVAATLFDGDLPPTQRRFAVLEMLAHLEYLRVTGRVERTQEAQVTRYFPCR